MAPVAIYTDADNTLWDTDLVFQSAQLALLEEVERLVKRTAEMADRLAFVRDYDQAIASLHHDGLRYPPNLLAHALVLGLRGAPATEAARRVIRAGHLTETEDGVQRFLSMLKARPPLLPGVAEGFRLAANAGARPYVVTEGRQEKVAQLLKEHGLLEWSAQVLSATKTVALYSRLKMLARATDVVMIGDQLDRDVTFAHKAGLLTVWVPSAFRPKWNDGVSSENASFVASDFLSAITWVLETRSSPRTLPKPRTA